MSTRSKKKHEMNIVEDYFSKSFEKQMEEELNTIAESSATMEEKLETSEVSQEEPIQEMSLSDVLVSLKTHFNGLPVFQPSFFQIKYFELGQSVTPARAYLSCGRKLFDFLNEYFSTRRDYIECNQKINLLKEKLSSPEKYSEKERIIIQADLDVLIILEAETELKMNELLQLVSFLYNEYIKFPKFNRSDIEQAEREFYIKSALKSDQYVIQDLETILFKSAELDQHILNEVSQRMT